MRQEIHLWSKVISIFFVAIFIAFCIHDTLTYNRFNNSAPIYVILLEPAGYYLLPAIVFAVLSWICKPKSAQ